MLLVFVQNNTTNFASAHSLRLTRLFVLLDNSKILKGLSSVTGKLCCQSAFENRSGAAEAFPYDGRQGEVLGF